MVENVALDLAGSTDYPRLDPEDWRQAVRDADTSQADAIFVSCTNIRITDAIDHIEQDFGKPVVTSNQAGLWYSLRRIGFPTGVSGYGSLLRDHLSCPHSHNPAAPFNPPFWRFPGGRPCAGERHFP